jgi:hypothetical protein
MEALLLFVAILSYNAVGSQSFLPESTVPWYTLKDPPPPNQPFHMA